MKIVADENIPFLKGALEPFAEVEYLPGKKITHDLIRDADGILIRTRTKCTESLLQGTNIRFIGTATIGFDHIDTQYCESKNISWTNAPGCNSSSVQQYITAALLKLERDYKFNLKDKTIGIIGVGNVGSKVEKVASLLGMNVLLNDPPRSRNEGDKKFVNLDVLLRKADVVSLHVPLNIVGDDITYHLFNCATIKKMKKGIWLFNSSRGEVIDSTCLKKSLGSGKLAGAVLDVWENEPDIDLDLMTKTFIATPHIAGYSTDGKANGTAMVVNSLCNYFGLNLKDWYPKDLPLPFNTDIVINCKGRSDNEIIRDAVFNTYNIEEDDIRLRFSPSDFEKQRGNYPLRREYSSFCVHLKSGTKKVQKTLETLGFKVIAV